MGKEKQNKVGWTTTKKERLAYYFGLGGSRLMQSNASTNLSIYMIFLGIDLRLVAGIMLAVRILDAVDDLFFGWICDRFHFKKDTWLGKGYFMPWVKLGVFFLPVSTLLMYHIPTSLADAGKLVWFVITYIMWDLSFTVTDVPNTAIPATMTADYNERNAIQNVRYTIPIIFGTPLGLLNTFLISEQVGMPISRAMTLMVIICVAMTLPQIFMVRERNTVKSDNVKEDYTVSEMFQFLKSNKDIQAVIGTRIVGGSFRSTMGLFACFYLLGSSLFNMLYGLISLPVVIIYIVAIPFLLKKFEKWQIMRAVYALLAIAGVLCYLVGYDKNVLIVHFILNALIMLFTVPDSMMSPMLITDLVEEVKYKEGIDVSGIAFSLNTFAEKLAQAISNSLPLFFLGFVGWNSVTATDFAELAAMNITQPASALNGLWICHTLFPAIGGVLGFIAFLRYKLGKKEVEIMTHCNNGTITKEDAEDRLNALKKNA